MVDVATLGLSIDSKQAVKAKDDLKGLEDQAVKTEKAADNLGKGVKQTTTSLSGVKVAASAAAAAMAAFASAMAVRAVTDAVDLWSDLNSRVRLATGSIEAGSAVMRRLNEISKVTYSSLNTTAESFLKVSTSLKELGYSTNQALDYTEALNNAIVVSGAKGQRAEQVANALGKAMAAGALRGNELNTIIESGGRVSELLAQELGVTTNQLRKLGTEGKITGDVIYKSLVGNMQTLKEEAESMDATLGDAGQRWADAFLYVVGSMDQATGASSALANVLVDMANAVIDGVDGFIRFAEVIGSAVGPAFNFIVDNAGVIANALAIATAAIVGFSSPAIVASLWALSTALFVGVVGAIKAITVAMLANPLGLLIAGISAAVVAAYVFRDELKDIFDAIVEAIRVSVNLIIGSFVGAFNAVKTLWNQFPNVMKDIGLSVLNFYIGMWEDIANFGVKAFNKIIEGANKLLNFLGVSGLSEILGLGDAQIPVIPAASFSKLPNPYQNTTRQTMMAMQDDFNVGLASEFWKANVQGVEDVTEAAAGANEELDALLNKTIGAPEGGGEYGVSGSGGAEGGRTKEESRLEELKKDLESLREQYKTEQELLLESEMAKNQILNDARAANLISAQEHAALMEEVQREHATKMLELQLMPYADALGSIGGLMGDIASVVGENNDAMLAAQRLFGVASALISMYVGAAKALELPFPANFGAMAAVLAQGVKLVAGIKSGSSSVSSGGGGAAARPQAPVNAPEPTKQAININLDGEDDFISKKTVAKIMNTINDLNKDGHMLIVTGG